MPRWPGIVLTAGGAVLFLGAIGAAAAVTEGYLSVDDPAIFAWLALIGGAALLAGLVYIAIRQLRVRRHLPPERYRGPAVFVLVVLVLAFILVLSAPFAEDATAIVMGEGDLSVLGSIVLLAAAQVGMLLVSWLLVFRPGALAGLPSLPGSNAGRVVLSGIGWGVLATFGAGLVSNALVYLLDLVGVDAAPQTAAQAIALVEPWVAVLSIVVLAPIAEEVFFRGVVFNALLREGGRRWAYLGSSALFAIIHFEPVAMLPLFLLGLALAWVYQRSANLLAPIVMHATVNGIAVALALLVRYEMITLPT